MGSLKCPNHQALSSCEASLDLDSVETHACADGVGASENSLTDANLLYDGDDLPLLALSRWRLLYTQHGQPYKRGHAYASPRVCNGSVRSAFINSSTAQSVAHGSINILPSPGPLSAGPAGYAYTALLARSTELESFRHDYDIRFKKYASLRTILHWWLLCDEDAAPARFKEWIVAFLKSLNINRLSLTGGKNDIFERTKNWVCKKIGGVFHKT